MAYGDFKDLPRTKPSDKMLRGKAFNIANNLKYDGYKKGLASMIYKIFDKKSIVCADENDNMSNPKLAKEIRKQTIRKFEKSKGH